MQIINSHVHLIEIEAMLAKYKWLTSLPSGINTLAGIEQLVQPLLSVATLLKQMDEAGVEKSVLYAVEAPIVYASNEYVAELCSQHPDRLIGFASVDPKKTDALQVLDKAVNQLGLRGLKFHPPLQDFFPNDEEVFPVYEWAQKHGLPVVFHVGSTPFGALCRLSQANPLLLDEVAVAFPNLKIILTHLGTLWQHEAFMVVEKNENVYIDTAAYLYEIESLLNMDLVHRLGEDKIIFGTDYPMPFAGKVHQMADFVSCIKKLPLEKDVIRKIFSDNFSAILA